MTIKWTTLDSQDYTEDIINERIPPSGMLCFKGGKEGRKKDILNTTNNATYTGHRKAAINVMHELISGR